MMVDTNIGSVHKVISSESKIPIFTGKAVEVRPWLAALKKKEWINKLTDSELVNLAYDFSERISSEWIGEYLDNHKEWHSATEPQLSC